MYSFLGVNLQGNRRIELAKSNLVLVFSESVVPTSHMKIFVLFCFVFLFLFDCYLFCFVFGFSFVQSYHTSNYVPKSHVH